MRRLLSPHLEVDGRADLEAELGPELARVIWRAANHFVLRDVEGSREVRDAAAGESAYARRVAALALMILGELHLYKGQWRASTRRLYQGRTYTYEECDGGNYARTKDGKRWVYVPGKGDHARVYVRAGQQGGLAARLGTSVREVGRYQAALRECQVFDVGQPRGADDRIKGSSGHPYARWTLRHAMPLAVSDYLSAFRGQPMRRAQSTHRLAHAGEELSGAASAGETPSGDVPTWQALLEKMATRGPPPDA